MPFVDNCLERGLARELLDLVLDPHQDVELPDLVQQPREERVVGIELRAHTREHVRERSGVHAVLPDRSKELAHGLAAVADEHLLRGVRQRDVAHHPVAELRDGGGYARDRLAASVEQSAVRDLHDPRRERRVGAYQARDLGDRHVLVRERVADLERDLGQRRQLEVVVGERAIEVRDERGTDRPGLVVLDALDDGGVGGTRHWLHLVYPMLQDAGARRPSRGAAPWRFIGRVRGFL